MKKIFKVAIIGGGFSGLICAEVLSSYFGGENVIVLEKNDRVGKKILATGNGRGNITNVNLSCENYHSECGASVEYALEKYGNKSIIAYFNSLGVACSEDEGKIYPSSFQANSILDTLRLKLEYLNTEIKTQSEVLSIEKTAKHFSIKTQSGEYLAEKVVLSCGGKAGKQYGTDGSAYRLATSLGHKVTNLYPSLVQIKTKIDKIKGLKGLKQQAEVSVVVEGKKVKSFVGDLLFTDFGVSGNTAFYLSSYLPKNAKAAELNVSFLPDKSFDEIAQFVQNKLENNPYIEIGDVLTGIVNKQIGKAILKDLGELKRDRKSAYKIASAVKNFKLEIVGTLGFDYAQVTKGGIVFSEIDEKTMMSKKCKGLYIVGEMLDVDGDCGGYNLQWSYSSARVACDDMVKL